MAAPSDTPPGGATRAAIEAQALRWFLAHRGAEGAGREAGDPDFARWLAADPAHGEAYRAVRAAWDDMGGLDDLASEAARLAMAHPPPPRPRVGRRMVLAGGAGALAAGVLGVAVAPALVDAWRADLSTGVGEVAVRRLADGSTLTLDADSALTVAIDGGRREVALLRGRASFAVAADPARPFLVRAGDGITRALPATGTVAGAGTEAGAGAGAGAEFAVAHVGEAVEVTVARHAVAVALGDAPSVALSGALSSAPASDDDGGDPARVHRITAGHRGRYGAAGFAAVRPVDAAAALAWRAGKLVFDDRPLREVVEEIARYHPGRIVITDDAIARRAVSGVVDRRQPERALQAVVGTLPVRMHRFGPFLTVLRPA